MCSASRAYLGEPFKAIWQQARDARHLPKCILRLYLNVQLRACVVTHLITLLMRLQELEAPASAPAAAPARLEPMADDVMQDIGASQTGDPMVPLPMPTPLQSPRLGRALFDSPIPACAGAPLAAPIEVAT